MAHSMILGLTESGKTCLAKSMARELTQHKKKVAVFDPLSDPEWGENAQTFDSVEDLVEYLQSERNVYVFVDESGAAFDEGRDNTHLWLATRSRHYGHSVAFIAQRMVQIPRTMRDQTARIFLFTSSRKDGKEHAEEWNKDQLETCNVLPQFHFYTCGRYDAVQEMKLVNYSQVERVTGGTHTRKSRKSAGHSGTGIGSVGGGQVDTEKGTK